MWIIYRLIKANWGKINLIEIISFMKKINRFIIIMEFEMYPIITKVLF